MAQMRYRLALDLGSTSLGWAMIRLNHDEPPAPTAVVKAGVRIFSNGREPAAPGSTGTSLAAARREKRAMRRRRDRLLKRKERMTNTLIKYKFFPADEAQRKALVTLNPYALRAKGLDKALTPSEFARALFHINQRRGFKSNRKADKSNSEGGAMNLAISVLRNAIATYPKGVNGKPLPVNEFDLCAWVDRKLDETRNTMPRTIGELLNRRQTDMSAPTEARTTRAQ